MSKTVIAGGRNYYLTAEDEFYLDSLDISVVVSGGAKGADYGGIRYAEKRDLDYIVFEADWNTNGKAAGPIRNREMAEYADAVVVFPGGRGTDNMYQTALKKGLVIHDKRGKEMSTTITGKVTKKSRAGTGIVIDDGSWLNGAKSVLKAVEWKDQAELTLDDSGNVISAKKLGGESVAPAAAGGKSSWVDSQPVIGFRSALHMSMEFFKLCKENGAVSLPEDEKDRMACIEAFMQEHTEKFYHMSEGIRKGDPVDVVLYGADGE